MEFSTRTIWWPLTGRWILSWLASDPWPSIGPCQAGYPCQTWPASDYRVDKSPSWWVIGVTGMMGHLSRRADESSGSPSQWVTRLMGHRADGGFLEFLFESLIIKYLLLLYLLFFNCSISLLLFFSLIVLFHFYFAFL